jgi:hypothetical protein
MGVESSGGVCHPGLTVPALKRGEARRTTAEDRMDTSSRFVGPFMANAATTSPEIRHMPCAEMPNVLHSISTKALLPCRPPIRASRPVWILETCSGDSLLSQRLVGRSHWCCS